MVWCKLCLLMKLIESNVFFLSTAVLFIHLLLGVVQTPAVLQVTTTLYMFEKAICSVSL